MKRTNWVIATVLLAISVGYAAEGIHLPTGRNTNFMWTTKDLRKFQWDISNNGSVSNGSDDAYDGGMQLQVNGSGFSGFSSGRIDATGTEVEIGPWRHQNLSIYRRIFVNRERGYCRWVDIFENNQASDITVSLRYYSNMGEGTQRTYTTAGKAKLTKRDWSIITAGNPGSSRPAIVHVFASPTAKLKPEFRFTKGNDNLFYHYSLRVPAGKTVAVCFFEAQRRPYEAAIKCLKAFNVQKELSYMPKALRDILVNMPGATVSIGNTEMARNNDSDLLVLRNGNEMLGKIDTKEFVIQAEFGKVTVAADQVIGLLGSSANRNDVRMVLLGGQVISGELTSGDIQFTLAGGTELKIPASGLKHASYQVSPAKPEEIAVTDPLVMLRSGARLAFDAAKLPLQFRTAHGKLTLAAADLQAIEMDTPEGGLHRAIFRNHSILAGLLMAKELDLQLTLGMKLKIPRQRVARLYFGNAPAEPANLAALTLTNTNILHGLITDKKWSVHSKLSDIDVACGDIASCEFTPGALGQVKITLHNGTKLAGKLKDDYINFQVSPGPAMKIFVGQITSLTGAGAPDTTKPDTDEKPKPTTGPVGALEHQRKELEAQLAALKANIKAGNPEAMRELMKVMKLRMVQLADIEQQLADARKRAAIKAADRAARDAMLRTSTTR